MDCGWRPITEKREEEWMRLAAGMTQGILFEYFPSEDRVVYTRYNQGKYRTEKCLENCSAGLKSWVHPEDYGELERLNDQIEKRKAHIYSEFRVCTDPKHPGSYGMGAVQGHTVYDGEEIRVVGQMYRMGAQWKEKQRIYDEAKRDSMTHLWNHKYTVEYICEYLGERGRLGSLLLIDVDNFKKINDTMGHLFGDQVIQSVSRVLCNTFRSSDIIGRMGGDEFLVFMKGVDSEELIRQKCNEVCGGISKIYCGEQAYKVSASIGVSRCPVDGLKYEELFEKADSALYYIKGSGKNNCAVYNKEMSRIAACGRDFERLSEELQAENEDGYDEFYNEITKLAFRLMADTTDADSAIQLLLYKLQEHFGLDAVRIQEVSGERPRTLRCVYEVAEERLSGTLFQERQYTEGKWLSFLNAMEHNRYQTERIDAPGPACSLLRIPLGNKKYFNGVVDFVYASKCYNWEEREIKFLDSFSRILSVYLTRIRTLDQADLLATVMQERDSITGLYTYDKFKERMQEVVSFGKDRPDILYIYTDIEHFKYINDTYGYDTGDMVLRQLAGYMVSRSDRNLLCIARVHSDNIVAALSSRGSIDQQAMAGKIAEFNQAAAKMLRQYVHDDMISVQSGLFLAEDGSVTVEEAVSNASYACREAKQQSGCRCNVFTGELRREYKKQLHFLSGLKGAIDRRELTVYIQPKVLSDGVTASGGEALVRWTQPGSGMAYPNDFIPVFEKSGAIVELDYFVYREVFSYLRDRLDAGLPVVPVSMNVSRVHLENGRIVEYIDELQREFHVNPGLLEFELTESIYIENLDKAIRFCSSLKDRGIKVSMDDFGSGYSSLNMLNRMPVDVMKIDRIFLKNEVLEESDRIILDCVVQMAKKLNVCVVCEGVETEAQYRFLKEIGCDSMQGYYFGKPMPVEEFDRFLLNRYVGNARRLSVAAEA